MKKLLFAVAILAVIGKVATAYAVMPRNIDIYGNTFNEGALISANQSAGDPDIFIVNDHGYKRLFLNPAIFAMYGHLGGYANVRQVSPAVRDAYVTSGLFRNCETNDQAVWATEVTGEDTGILHHVQIDGAAAIQQDPNFFNKVFCINTNEEHFYPKSVVPYTSLSQIPSYVRNQVCAYEGQPAVGRPCCDSMFVYPDSSNICRRFVPTPTPSPLSLVYSNSNVGFQITMTNSWNGYWVTAFTSLQGGELVDFWKNWPQNGGGYVSLSPFRVGKMSTAEWNNRPVAIRYETPIITVGDTIYYYGRALVVPSDNQAMVNAVNDIPSIIASFKLWSAPTLTPTPTQNPSPLACVRLPDCALPGAPAPVCAIDIAPGTVACQYPSVNYATLVPAWFIHVGGIMPTPCDTLGTPVMTVSGSTIRVNLPMNRPDTASCAQVVQSFTVDYAVSTYLPGLTAGTYGLYVNGVFHGDYTYTP